MQATHDNHGYAIGEQEKKSKSPEGDEDAVSKSNINYQTGIVSSSKEAEGTPAPLATKVYHLQGDHRRWSALGRIYIETVTSSHGCDIRKKLVLDSAMMSSEDRSPHKLLIEATEDDISRAEKATCPATTVPNTDQILAQSSELCFGSNRGYLLSIGLTNKLLDSNFPKTGLAVDGASAGMMRARYHPGTYPSPSNAGTALGTIQQPDGSVPVV